MKSQVVIVGGGMSGLAAGIALTRAGIEVTILEERCTPRPDVFGYTLWPPATRALRSLDLLDDVVQAGCRLEALRWYAGDGQELLSADLSLFLKADPFVGIAPSKLIEILDRGAEGAGVRILRGIHDWELHTDGADEVSIRATSEEEGDFTISTSLVIGSDGMQSKLRERLNLRCRKWRPTDQVIITGVGKGVAFRESRQTIGSGWSDGYVSLGPDHTWVYAIVRIPKGQPGPIDIASCEDIRPETRSVLLDTEPTAQVRPWSLRVAQWEADRVVVIGDAAHGILPHLGLGGALSLGDVLILAEMVPSWLESGDRRAATLKGFRQRRNAEVSYFRRVTERWAWMTTMNLPGFDFLREYTFKRLTRKPEIFDEWINAMARSEVPGLRVRFGVWLP